MTWQLRDIEDDADRRAYVDLLNTLQPEWPTSVDELAWQDETFPGPTASRSSSTVASRFTSGCAWCGCGWPA